MNYSLSWSAAEIGERSVKRPTGRFAFACTRYGSSTVFIHGGCSWLKGRKFKFLDDMWTMKIPSPGHVQWEMLSQRGQTPGPRANHHLCYVSRMLYLFGGKMTLEDKRAVSGMHVYDYTTQCWYLQHVEGEEHPYCLGSSSAVIDNQIFTFGGMLDGMVTSKTHLFDPQTTSWSCLETCGAIPPARCDHGACTVKSSLFIHGGCAAADVYLSDLYELDTNTLLWTRLEFGGVNNIPRAGHSLTAHHAKDLYVFGGHNDLIYPDGGPVTEELNKYSIGQKRWKTPRALPTDYVPIITYDHSAIIIQGCLYIIGGLGLDGLTNDVQVARLISPSARRMASEEALLSLPASQDMDSSGVYDCPAGAIAEEIYAEPFEQHSTADSRHVRFRALPKNEPRNEEFLPEESARTTPPPQLPTPPMEAPPPLREIQMDSQATPIPEPEQPSSRRSSEGRRLMSPPPPPSSGPDSGMWTAQNGRIESSASSESQYVSAPALQSLNAFTEERTVPAEDSSTTSDNDNSSISDDGSYSESDGEEEKVKKEQEEEEKEGEKEGNGAMKEEEENDEFSFEISRRPDTAQPAGEEAWRDDVTSDLEVPIETDNGNDDDDDSEVDAGETTLTTAERQQLEQLSLRISTK